MILSNNRKRSASKPPSAMKQLIAQAENAAFRHQTAENAMIKGDQSRRADFVAYTHEHEAIAERASFMPSESALGAAFQLALATGDAEGLYSGEWESRVAREETIARINRLFGRVLEYLQSQGVACQAHLPIITACAAECISSQRPTATHDKPAELPRRVCFFRAIVTHRYHSQKSWLCASRFICNRMFTSGSRPTSSLPYTASFPPGAAAYAPSSELR